MSPSAKPKPRSRLTREEVASAALELLDREGLDALSMRRLAAELEVGTMTLYGYFRSKEELLDGAVDAAVAASELVEPESGPWQDRLRTLMRRTRSTLSRHPALVALRVHQPVLRPEALRLCEQVMRMLTGAGLSNADAARGFRLLFTYVFGYAAFSPAGSEREAAARSREAVAALPAGAYPAMIAASGELAAAMAGEEAFEFGLDLIIEGLERHVEQGEGTG